MSFAFDAVDALITQGVNRHLTNASIRLSGGAVELAALYDCTLPTPSPFVEVAAVPAHTVSACVVALPTLAEGSELILTTASLPPGQLCRITTSVVPDAGGWASFEVVMLGAALIAGDDHV